ncbi:class I SAM-dependent methyltransferase [Crocinitomicaceae bacterium]|nr:class I SAM-dependent methyltransferase [Crocinitomicaceae bacterium]
MRRKECLICKEAKLTTVLDLGLQPFADTFIPENLLHETEPIYPLKIDLCDCCGHIQTHIETNPDDRYSKYEYSFLSSSSGIAKKHWQEYAKDVNELTTNKKKLFVLEIGSNDGYLGKCVMDFGHNYLGVDASPVMVDIANKSGIETWHGLFNIELARKIEKKIKKADFILANNVFNHIDDLHSFMDSIDEILSPNGFFIIEVPYWLLEFKEMNFGKIYHEHVNYFTIKSLKTLFDQFGFKITDINVNEYHGGTMRVYASKNHENTKLVQKYLKDEQENSVHDCISYPKISIELKSRRNQFLVNLMNETKSRIPVIGIGAAAKGNTFLNYHNLDFKTIDYISDISPTKIGKHTPMSRIPIVNDDIFKNYNEVIAIVLTENISPKLKSILLGLNPQIKFIDTI